MREYAFDAWRPLVTPHGRVLDLADGSCFNWSCSGFTIRFTGSRLLARLVPAGEPSPVLPPAAPVIEYPHAGVSEDGKTLARRFVCQTAGWYTLFDGAMGEHTLRLVKITENLRGKLLLSALSADGELLQAPPETGPVIEFVGDSITCGYGNEAPGRDAPFRPEEENGWMAFGPQAARELGVPFRCVSVSGIAVSAGRTGRFSLRCPQMEELYPYTDRLAEERHGGKAEQDLTGWRFQDHPARIVVVNLGTNDVNPIRFASSAAEAGEEEKWFFARYSAFIRLLRRLNGPESWICCILGPLDYYLYDQIEKAVALYRRETGDTRAAAFKLAGVNLLTEGFGADGHPSLKTHTRMGHELAEKLRPMLELV